MPKNFFMSKIICILLSNIKTRKNENFRKFEQAVSQSEKHLFDRKFHLR